ncbi:MAG TPA: FAD-dependent monooxygenase [Aliidongia sp.]|uniref:FAD-dependent monooxygenase n=1 Tax=Aliidongia sp. TaxID=1914230 RepID=UPI002DDDA3E2|nr:FAD-dependent monooxygenase [Aliidongia sp.]HEV2677513.1 FAD-dependent monooxygenase [Aliidongia sp.]
MEQKLTDVVIVGAGPVGLMLAIELTLGGARVIVLERLSNPDETIKAGAIGALAGEALERRGFEPAMDAEERIMSETMAALFKTMAPTAGRPAVRKIGGHFSGLFLIDQTRQREPARRLRGIRQQPLEQMLNAKAQALGIDVRRNVELLDFSQDDSGVAVVAVGPDGEMPLRCQYLIGCDGGRSRVRKQAGFGFPGTDPTITGYQALVELDHPERLLPLGWRRTATGMLAYGPIPGRILTVEFAGAPVDRDAPVTVAEVQASLRRVSGADVTVTTMKSATRWTDNARQATSYRQGRVLLAGDAAHVHSPFGGQGLNLGLLDAVNLGWKLAAVVRGTMPDGLLDSYTDERHPVAVRVLANTRAQVALMRPDPQTSALREIVADIMALDEGNRFFGEMMSGVAIRYDLDDPHPLVGRISGDIELVYDETMLFELMQAGNAVLLDAGTGAASALAGPWQPQVRVVRVERGPSLLVRPDGCIAWASEADALDGLKAALVRWFGEGRPLEGTA